MAFDFPASPSEGALFQPAGGPAYKFTGGVWTVMAPLANYAFIGDIPPTSPVPGQLWWESDTGGLFIWFDDGNTQQWVQVTGPTAPTPTPARQTFAPNGVGTLAIPVPSTAKAARIRAHVFSSSGAGMGPGMRYSLDGSTFIAGATDYVAGGNTLYTGSSGNPTKLVPAAAAYMSLCSYTDRTDTPIFLDIDVVTQKVVGGPMFAFRSRAWSYHSAATANVQEALYGGYTNNVIFNTPTQLAAIQFFNPVGAALFAAGSVFTVDWVY